MSVAKIKVNKKTGVTTTIQANPLNTGLNRIKGVFGSVFNKDKIMLGSGQNAKDITVPTKVLIGISAVGTAAYGGALALTGASSTAAATTTAAATSGVSLKTAAIVGAAGVGAGLLLGSGGSAKSTQTTTPTQTVNPTQTTNPTAGQKTTSNPYIAGDYPTITSGRDTIYTPQKNLYNYPIQTPAQTQTVSPYQDTTPTLSTEQESTQTTTPSWLIPVLVGLGAFVLLKNK